MSWEKFLGEIEKACKEKKVAYEGLKRWIYEVIPNVEKNASAYHVAVGPTPRFKKMSLEVHVLVGGILHEFTVTGGAKEYNIYKSRALHVVHQSTSEGYVKFEFYSFSTAPLLIIEVEEKYMDTTRRFVQQIVKTWG